MLLTIFLKHCQSMNLAEINQKLEATGFWKKFPPEGTEVLSWYVLMGIGQVVTLKLPTGKLREVNLAVEQNGWGAFETEFYPTYDFAPIREGLRAGAGRLLERTRRLTRSAKKRPRRSGARVKVGIESATAANAVKFQSAPPAPEDL